MVFLLFIFISNQAHAADFNNPADCLIKIPALYKLDLF